VRRNHYLRPSPRLPEIYLYRVPIDFRKQAQGLALLVEQELGHNPFICVAQDYVAATLPWPLFRGRGLLGRHIIQMDSSNRSTASFGWNRAGWQPATPALSKPRRIISTSAAA